MRLQLIWASLALAAQPLTAAAEAKAPLHCAITEYCADGDCAAPEGDEAKLSLNLLSDETASLSYRGEEIALFAGAAAGSAKRWSGKNALGEVQSFALKPDGAFLAVTVFEGTTTAKASGQCEGA